VINVLLLYDNGQASKQLLDRYHPLLFLYEYKFEIWVAEVVAPLPLPIFPKGSEFVTKKMDVSRGGRRHFFVWICSLKKLAKEFATMRIIRFAGSKAAAAAAMRHQRMPPRRWRWLLAAVVVVVLCTATTTVEATHKTNDGGGDEYRIGIGSYDMYVEQKKRRGCPLWDTWVVCVCVCVGVYVQRLTMNDFLRVPYAI
jgi:hypothetical protein